MFTEKRITFNFLVLLLIAAACTAKTSSDILIVMFRVGFEMMRKFGRTGLHDLQCENWRFW